MHHLTHPASLLAITGAIALSAALAAETAGAAPILSPAPGTPSALPGSEISFLGVAAGSLSAITVIGSLSGRHGGRLRAYSSALGASFRPARPFADGERVSVHARWRRPAGRPVSISSSFTVATPVALRLTEPPASAPAASERQSFQSAPELHPPSVTVHLGSGATPGYLLASPGPGGGQTGPMIFDGSGALVWFKALPAGEQAADFRTQVFHGKDDLTWWEGHTNQFGYGLGQDVIVNANYRPVAVVRAGNGLAADEHEFLVGSRGSAWVLAYSPVRADLAPLGGPADVTVLDAVVQEIDIHTGLVMWEWHSLGHIAMSESFASPPAGPGTPYDYLHIDSLDVDEYGNLLLSARNASALYAIDGRSGAILWRLGGRRSSFTLGAGVPFSNPGDATFLAGRRVGLIDGGGVSPTRAEVLKLDERARTATLSLALARPSGTAASGGEGSLQGLPEGGWMVGWGAGGELTEFDAGGRIVYDAGLAPVLDSHRVYREPWGGLPTTAPALREINAGSLSTVYASWNGATTATSWQLLTGSTQSDMTAVSTTPRSGFETTIPAPGAAYYEVRALSASGKVLASSRVVAAGGR